MHTDIYENVVMRPDSLTWEKPEKCEKSILDKVDWESSFLRLEPACKLREQALSEGEEYLVLEGFLLIAEKIYPAGSYFRFPTDSEIELSSGEEALIYVKIGHLKLKPRG